MTDRVNAITVVLKKDTRTDDVEQLLNAILMLKGVENVKLNVSDLCEKYIAEVRVKSDLMRKVLAAFEDEWPG